MRSDTSATPHDNADEPRRARPSVPLVVFDAGGRPMWKQFGRDAWVYEPELERVWRAAQRPRRITQLALWDVAA